MAVSGSDKLGFKLLFSATKEKFVRGENSFYDNFKNEKPPRYFSLFYFSNRSPCADVIYRHLS